MMASFPRFVLLFVVVLSVVFGLHVLLLHLFELPLFENRIILSYLINALLAVFIMVFLFKMRVRFKSHIGFLFMAGSFLKFAAFFIFFYPVYQLDQELTRVEFFAFFVPYATSLFLETVFLSKMLNNM